MRTQKAIHVEDDIFDIRWRIYLGDHGVALNNILFLDKKSVVLASLVDTETSG